MSREEYKDAIEVSVIFHKGQRMFAVPKQPAQQKAVAWMDDDGNLHREKPHQSYGPEPRPLVFGDTSPQPVQQQEPVAGVWEMFAAYLIDKCEGEIITEEGLQRSLADMLADPNYATPQPAQRKPLTDEAVFSMAEIAWRHGWASCRDAEYVGEGAEDERWGEIGAEVVQSISAHNIKQALVTQPAPVQQEPVAYAGVKAWVGNKQVIQCVTQTELHYATQPWLLMLMNAEKCIAALKENT